MTPRQESSRARTGSGNPVSEWAAAAIGLLILAGTLGFGLYEGIWGDHSPPDIVVEVTGITRVNAGYRIEFRATNLGGSTAEGVVIEARLTGPSDAPDTSETTLDYLPGHSHRMGGLFLPSDPARGALVVRALGYQRP